VIYLVLLKKNKRLAEGIAAKNKQIDQINSKILFTNDTLFITKIKAEQNILDIAGDFIELEQLSVKR